MLIVISALSPEWKWVGILVLVAVFLFLASWKGLTFVIERFGEVDVRHNQTVQAIHADHKAEREDWKNVTEKINTEWRESTERSNSEVRAVIKEFTKAIKESAGQ